MDERFLYTKINGLQKKALKKVTFVTVGERCNYLITHSNICSHEKDIFRLMKSSLLLLEKPQTTENKTHKRFRVDSDSF